MEEILAGMNWIAVILGAVAAFIVGWLWYSPILFGKTWAAGNNVELGSAQSMPFGAMAAQFIGLFLLAWFVGAVGGSIFITFLAVAAFSVLALSGGMFIKKPTNVVAIDFGYWIVAAIVMVIVQAIF